MATSTRLEDIVAQPGVREWWGSLDDAEHTREGPLNNGAAFAIEIDGRLAGWLGYNEQLTPTAATPASTSSWRPSTNGEGSDAPL